jgi:predicted CoA-binding protein
MNDDEIRGILRSVRTVASVGLSANPDKPSYDIARYLQAQGYTIIPVNPTVPEVLGLRSYPDLAALPEVPDVVQIFRPPKDVPAIVEQAIALGARVVWMQPGAGNPAAAETARRAGRLAVVDRCMRSEHQRLIGPGNRGTSV